MPNSANAASGPSQVTPARGETAHWCMRAAATSRSAGSYKTLRGDASRRVPSARRICECGAPKRPVILEVFVEPACAVSKQPVEISPLLLLDDRLLLFPRIDDCVAAIDIGLGAWGAFRPARRIILARNGRLLACKSGRYAGGGCHDQQNAKKPHGYSPKPNPCSRFWRFGVAPVGLDAQGHLKVPRCEAVGLCDSDGSRLRVLSADIYGANVRDLLFDAPDHTPFGDHGYRVGIGFRDPGLGP